MIKVENLSVSYGKGMPDVIRDMNFDLRKADTEYPRSKCGR